MFSFRLGFVIWDVVPPSACVDKLLWSVFGVPRLVVIWWLVRECMLWLRVLIPVHSLVLYLFCFTPLYPHIHINTTDTVDWLPHLTLIFLFSWFSFSCGFLPLCIFSCFCHGLWAALWHHLPATCSWIGCFSVWWQQTSKGTKGTGACWLICRFHSCFGTVSLPETKVSQFVHHIL